MDHQEVGLKLLAVTNVNKEGTERHPQDCTLPFVVLSARTKRYTSSVFTILY